MKYLMAVPLMLHLCMASAYAQQRAVKMTFSGSMVPTSIEVQPNTVTDEELLAGSGAPGSFTFRKLRTDETSPQGFGSCGVPNSFGPILRVVAGGGVFRFEDGSLLTVLLTDGTLCIDVHDVNQPVGYLTENYQVTGGTLRLASASGALRLTGRIMPVMFSASGAVVLLTDSGQIEGTLTP